MKILESFSVFCITTVNELIMAISKQSKMTLFIVPFLFIVLWVVGKKLRRFVKPSSPLISPIIREIGYWMEFIGQGATIVQGVYLILIYCLVVIAYIASSYTQYGLLELLIMGLGAIWEETKSESILIITGSIFGLLIAYFLTLRVIPRWERGVSVHEIQQSLRTYKGLNNYDPSSYFDLKLGCFLGLDLDDKPIYVEWGKILKSHIQVLGNSGCGKGMVVTSILCQSIMKGVSVMMIDPKFDRFSSRIFRDFAKRSGKDFVFINLNPDQPPQFNILAGVSQHEFQDLIFSAFDLNPMGTDGDYHRSLDEKAAIAVSKVAARLNSPSVKDLIRECSTIKDITDQKNFWNKLCKLGDLEAINTNEGINLENAIKNGATIYVAGSITNQQSKMAQKMVLVRFTQLSIKKDRIKDTFDSTIVLDELKHSMCKVVTDNLGAIRDFDTNLILAHQSMGDLLSCPGISPEEAVGAVVDNTSIKLIFKQGDTGYAEKLSKLSGKKKIYIDQVDKRVDDLGQTSGSWREAQVPVIDSDVFTNLPIPNRNNPAAVGVVIGLDTAKEFYIGQIPAYGELPLAVPAQPCKSDNISDCEVI